VDKGVVRFKVPETGQTVINDKVLGTITIKHEEIEDFVIARADGTPTYNFTVVVDDALMGITHVIRGDDHVNNTPKQILIYEALGLSLPIFVHVPMILGPDKTKLSKRHGATAVSSFRQVGYLPEALFNYLVRLGWSHGDQEIFSKEELVQLFDLDALGHSAAVLNMEKLNWLNAHYIKSMSAKDMAKRLCDESLVPEEFKKRVFDEDVQKLLPMVQERSKMLNDVYKGIEFFIKDEIVIDENAYKKHIGQDVVPIIVDLIEGIKGIKDISDHSSLEAVFKSLIEKHNIKLKVIAQACRVLITGTDVSPGIFEIMALMGKDKVIKRLSLYNR
ncbi:MAG TPA: glutamate--tRNA ligase, partial [bacterium]|nr:glutamate--tRNA ligase [bacterium]